MPLSVALQLECTADATLDQFTGRGVHGFWFRHWKEVDPVFASELHNDTQVAPFSLSPLMALPRPGRLGVVSIPAGHRAQVVIGALTDGLSEAMRSRWLPGLKPGQSIEIPSERVEEEQVFPGIAWRIADISIEECSYQELSRTHLMNSNPPRQWEIELLTPTTFHGKVTHLPFPLPESLVGSWLRRWQAFAPIALPEEEVAHWARTHLAISSYNLRTLPAREGDRLRVGCVGKLSLRALEMPPYLRAALDLLVSYARFCGSGAHTAQGLGQTRRVARR
jgi:CRISPR-associated endoribonuclease Cas6